MFSITIYARKSKRKNAKFKYKTYSVYDGKGAKSQYSYNMDFPDSEQWVNLMKVQFPYFRVVVYHNNICLRDFGYSDLSDYQALRIVHEFMIIASEYQKKILYFGGSLS